MNSKAQQAHVVFGAGARHRIAAALPEFGITGLFLLSSAGRAGVAEELAVQLGSAVAGRFAGAVMHTPVEVTGAALKELTATPANGLLSVGGGSTIGLGKALSFHTGLPHLVVPTTYSGSEATPILGQTENGIKTTLSDPAILPEAIFYDPELVTGLPIDLTVSSALNAVAHAAEALYAANRTPESDALATQGLQAFLQALPRVMAAPGDVDAREATLRGAWACGTVLGQVGMALHHKLCHALGGSFGLAHAETHAVILPHAIQYNAEAAQEELRPLAAMLDDQDPGRGLWQLAHQLGAPVSLQALGLAEADLDQAAEIATQNPYFNPRPVTRDGVRQLLQNAWQGSAPGA